MSIVEVKVPQLSESVAEATLLQWKKKVGQAVSADEILIDVETDKVVLEVPAPSAGVLVEIICADGSTVQADQPIARIDTAATASATPAASPATSAAGAAPETVSSGLSFASVLSPMPGTLFKSSTVLKLPFFLRYSIIAWAFAGPTPLSVSSCSWLAVLRFTTANALRTKLKDKIKASANFFMVYLFD